MTKFTVRRVRADDIPAISELVARTFSDGDNRRYQQGTYYWGNHWPTKPGLDLSDNRVGVVDDKVVAFACIEYYTLLYGSVYLDVAGVGSVCTHPDYRHRGYARSMLRDGLAQMAEKGAHLSLLNGITSYYSRFGFSSVWPHYRVEIDSVEAAHVENPLKVRDFRIEDIADLARLYEKHWDGRVTLTRDSEMWLWHTSNPNRRFFVVERPDGTPGGYLAGYDMFTNDVEVVVDNLETTATLLAHIGHIYMAMGIPRIQWLIPPDDAFITHARQLVPVTVSAAYQPAGGWMARLIDTGGLVDTILPEIIAQAQATDPAFDASVLHFRCNSDVVEIGLRGRRRTMISLNHRDFIQVMFGSLRPAELSHRANVDAAAVQLLQKLFPPRVATLPPLDWF